MLKLWTLALALAQLRAHHPRHLHDAQRASSTRCTPSPSRTSGPPSWCFIARAALRVRRAAGRARAPAGGRGPPRAAALRARATILVNNLVFVAITFTVLLGTLYPLITEAVRGVRVSVGEPYFNQMAVPGWHRGALPDGRGPDAAVGQLAIRGRCAPALLRCRRAWAWRWRPRAGGRDCGASTRCSPSGWRASSRSSPCASCACRRSVRMSEQQGGLVTARSWAAPPRPAALRRLRRAPGHRDHHRRRGRLAAPT